MSDGYSNITLLECNRLHSEQGKSGNTQNPALFTNKIGSGVHVKAGDQMSVYSSFISEIGAGADTIEFKGVDLNASRNFTYTNVVNQYPVNACNSKPFGYEMTSASNITITERIRDNKCTILLNYYKTANGEGHMHLPRRFMWSDVGGYGTGSVWVSQDSVGAGRPYEFRKGEGCTIPYVSSDYTTSVGGVQTRQKYFVEEDWFYYVNNQNQYSFIKKRTDGSKYKLFILDETKYGIQSESSRNVIREGISPAEWTYYEYIEKLDIELDKGFSSPSAIASKITNKLQESQEPVTLNYHQQLVLQGTSGSNITRPVSVIQQSNTYKPLYSANASNCTESGFFAWDSSTPNDEALKWMSSFKYIGIKRPDNWIAGRELQNQLLTHLDASNTNIGMCGFQFLFDLNPDDFLASAGSSGNMMVTNHLWDEKLLLKMKELFDTQEQYPEFFTNHSNHYTGITNASNSRFLHLNSRNSSVSHPTNPTLPLHLGTDNMYSNSSTLHDGFITKPLFIDFNPTFRNTLTDGESWSRGYAYGFAKKYRHTDDKDYIAFSTEHLGFPSVNHTIPLDYFAYNNGSSASNTQPIKKNTLLGYDVHFSAYGTSAMQIADGNILYSYDNIGFRKVYNINTITDFTNASANASVDIVGYSPFSYIGADEPKLEFNNTTNRFEWSNLHTSERIQNKDDAGGIDFDSKEIVPVNTNAGEQVYKLNKRIYNNTFTPDMLSYGANQQNACANLDGTDQPFQLDLLNMNIQPFSIMDAMSGIIIKDFGYTKETWNDGIWGILGFTYEQFNSQLNASNDLTSRVGENNNLNLNFAFTNADINAGDTINFGSNIFGAKTYSNNVPTPSLFVGTQLNIHDPSLPLRMYLQLYPNITNIAKSITLPAPNLPRRMLRPYYCIRSDIIDSHYIGGNDSGQKLPVVAIVNKINGDGDFFFQENEGVTHTFTQDKVITNITTSIHDPDQEFSHVNNDSAVIYKITKTIPASFDIVSQIMQNNQTKK